MVGQLLHHAFFLQAIDFEAFVCCPGFMMSFEYAWTRPVKPALPPFDDFERPSKRGNILLPGRARFWSRGLRLLVHHFTCFNACCRLNRRVTNGNVADLWLRHFGAHRPMLMWYDWAMERSIQKAASCGVSNVTIASSMGW